MGTQSAGDSSVSFRNIDFFSRSSMSKFYSALEPYLKHHGIIGEETVSDYRGNTTCYKGIPVTYYKIASCSVGYGSDSYTTLLCKRGDDLIIMKGSRVCEHMCGVLKLDRLKAFLYENEVISKFNMFLQDVNLGDMSLQDAYRFVTGEFSASGSESYVLCDLSSTDGEKLRSSLIWRCQM